MLYAGMGMMLLGWVLLQFFGVSQEDRSKGKDFTRSDTIGSFLLVGGLGTIVGYGCWNGGLYLAGKTEQLFYGAGSGYVVSLMECCAQACAGAAVLFFLSLMTLFKGESKYREFQRSDFARARRLRASFNFYATILFRVAFLVLVVTVGVFVVKGT